MMLRSDVSAMANIRIQAKSELHFIFQGHIIS
jgi:hypothetical protein